MILELSKGRQITIPAEMRKKLHITVGSKLEVSTNGKQLVLTPVGTELQDLFIHAKKIKSKHTLSASQMDKFNERLFS